VAKFVMTGVNGERLLCEFSQQEVEQSVVKIEIVKIKKDKP
jgi:hypothetical protein